MPSKNHVQVTDSNHLGVTAGPNTATSVEPSSPDPAAVRLQLNRLLTSPHIRNSKRCQALLKHVVEAHLDGCVERVKERCIGFEVFQRDADYDTSQDSIVRTTAAEVRKRLAQYYLEPEHEHELRLVLPHGSYLPEFHQPAPVPSVEAPTPVRPRRRWWRWVAAAAAVIAVSSGAAWWELRPTDFDRFWMPLTKDSADAIICIEQPLRIYRFTGTRGAELNDKLVGTPSTAPAPDDVLRKTTLNLSDLEPAGSGYFTSGDLIATARLAELLAHKGKAFQILGDRATTYRDLRGRPAILLGQFNNRWTQELTQGLRYTLDKDLTTHRYLIHDRQHPDKVLASVPQGNRPEEFVIVSRIFDVVTEKMVVAVKGATYFGTLAGGDFLTHQTYMEEALKGAPANWYHKNIQIVLKATRVSGVPGPPQVMTTYYW